jgi:magnesium-transporting ATPase (P-type)
MLTVVAATKTATTRAVHRPAARGDDDLTAPVAEETKFTVRNVVTSDVYALLESRPQGLSAAEASERLGRDGANVLERVRGPGLVRRLSANFTHFMALLLWVGAVIALAAGLPQLSLAIGLVNVVNGLFSFWQEYKAERATEALRRLLPANATVIRDGREARVRAEDLVVGDVVLLNEGDRVSADARLVDDIELRVDQSTLTGESRPVRKSSGATFGPETEWIASPNLVFAGTTVAAGRGTAVVHGTGMATEFGRIAQLTQGTARADSPLQEELRRLSVVVGVIAVAVGAVFFALAQLLTPMPFVTGFVFMLGMIVAFVPEGLLPTVTLALAMGSQKMAKRNALVKRLSAVETLGCTTVICTDKTGTLTQNEMTVRSAWMASGEVGFEGVGYDPAGVVTRDGAALATPVGGDLWDLLVAGGLANNARLLSPDEGESDRWTVLGDPTEAALKVAATKAGIDLDCAAAVIPRMYELPFDSTRKRMTTVHSVEGGRVVYVKGAPRELLALCTAVHVDGRDVPLDPRTRAAAQDANDAYSRDALRVLAVATRRLPDGLALDDAAEVEHDLTLLGLVGMLDPPHPEVTDAVAHCHSAGIRVVMMTGDYGLTAESVALRVGLIERPGVRIVNGNDLDGLDDAALDRVLDSDVLFARVAPEHKLRIVEALQRADHIVAVTGDGVNDAPALKRGDIGVAMGRAGTDVAKEAADMVLLDDNFASIVNAVEEGRSVYANIKKFAGYIFTSNTPEALPFIVFAFSGGQIPLALGIMHILAIDLGTDLVPALALGAEPPEPGVMDRPPRRRDEHLVTKGMLLRSYGWLGPLQSLVVMAAFFFVYWTAGYAGQWLGLPASGQLYRSATALALAAVVTTQIGNLFAHRTEIQSIAAVGWTSNRLVFTGVATELAVIAAIVYLPPLQALVGTMPFPAWHWLVVLAAAPLLLVADEARKALVRRYGKKAL